jgi:diadenosine tetraphosphate (Ap4A) HIT family hydrolase
VSELSELITDFKNKFRIEDLKIYETDYWIWSLRPHQATLGSGILSLKRQCGTFSELKQEEHCDLNRMIKVIEKSLSELFNYDVINYLMLMMFDKQVHFHVIPRYAKEVDFFGDKWRDESWPGIPSLLGEILDIEKLKIISLYIKDRLTLN